MAEHAGLVDRMGQRLLHEAVLSSSACHGGGHGVDVVGRAHRHGVDALAHLVEHLAEIVEPLRLLETPLAGGAQFLVVNSQMATMSPERPASSESLSPLPLMPMLAKAIRSLGDRLWGGLAPAATQ